MRGSKILTLDNEPMALTGRCDIARMLIADPSPLCTNHIATSRVDAALIEFCSIDHQKVLLKSFPTLRKPVEPDHICEIESAEADAPSLPVDPYRYLRFVFGKENVSFE